jgi:hypothetical protein
MAENNGFRHTGGGSDLLGGGAFEAFSGEGIEGGLEQLLSAVRGGHAADGDKSGHGAYYSKYLLTKQGGNAGLGGAGLM